MEREILFRGKRTDNGEWVYGDLITKPIHHECVILESGCINHAVDPETVGQYTNLHNKAGNKIFEGDKDDDGNVVEFVNGSWCLNGDRPIYDYHSVITGNIHEQPTTQR